MVFKKLKQQLTCLMPIAGIKKLLHPNYLNFNILQFS